MTKSFTALPWQLRILIIFVLLVAVGLGVLVQKAKAIKAPPPDIASGLILKTPRALQPFTLTNTQQQTIDPQHLRGQWTLLFFGFTHCPMICPTTLAELNNAYKFMQKQHGATLPVVMMVSIDPKRDTMSRLRDYMQGFNPKFIGARGSDPQVKILTQQLGIAYMQSKTQEGGSYDIDHSGAIVVINPAGKVQAFLSQPHKAVQMAKDFQQIVNFYQQELKSTS